jgi:hypothetical protein
MIPNAKLISHFIVRPHYFLDEICWYSASAVDPVCKCIPLDADFKVKKSTRAYGWFCKTLGPSLSSIWPYSVKSQFQNSCGSRSAGYLTELAIPFMLAMALSSNDSFLRTINSTVELDVGMKLMTGA